ncbi:enhanced serine sensitivity protein SseB C-terminal domain-containing protein [Streptomyces sp. NPDC059009]|uniref:enhanced serine sensitivity protein SseB C-terminal domain-containing protein n=1 Tax=Streptomyces sp. NPDC059009 TaxID=3346694 RepID=UPI0036CDD315
MNSPGDPRDPRITATPLIYRLADSTVLIGVKQTERGPEPLFTAVSGEPCAVAYTEPDEIREVLPDDYHLYQIPVVELLAQLPPVCGLLINPKAASPLYVAAEERDAVIAAGAPFPAGAFIRIKASAENPARLLPAVLARVADVHALRRLYCTRYQVADAREKILMVYDTGGAADGPAPDAVADQDRAVNDAIMEAAAETSLPDPMQIIALDDLPEEFRRLVLTDVEPCYVRADLRA